MTSKAYVCAKVVNQDGKLVVVDARIYSSPSTSLTAYTNKEMYMQVYECSGVDYESAHESAYRAIEGFAFMLPYKIIFDFIKKNEEAKRKHMESSGFTFAKPSLS